MTKTEDKQMFDDKRNLLQKKVDAFFVLKEVVHITYKNGHWVRGIILEVKSDFFILDERYDGKIPVFFEEISRIDKYISNKGEDSGNQ